MKWYMVRKHQPVELNEDAARNSLKEPREGFGNCGNIWNTILGQSTVCAGGSSLCPGGKRADHTEAQVLNPELTPPASPLPPVAGLQSDFLGSPMRTGFDDACSLTPRALIV